MGFLFNLRNLPLAVVSLAFGVSATSPTDLPVVDLGYTKHRALSYNVGLKHSDDERWIANQITGHDRCIQRN